MNISRGYWYSIVMVTGIMAGVLPAHTMATKCTCQAALACGADDCSPAGENGNDARKSCESVSATINTKTSELSICAFNDCWKGTAKAVEIGNSSTMWHGDFPRNSNANSTSSHVALFLKDGVGFAQVSDESGPLQLSLTCQTNN
ncbi:MAG: hypothetical protein ABJM26_07695 [Anderseniella sp.]|uniref:hypothetical protein n=1 Tax=Parasphingorhabdus sp. TaxID=2709688 RepID=UPI00327FD73C